MKHNSTKINESWMNQVSNGIGAKISHWKPCITTPHLKTQLETYSLEDVLKFELPAADTEKTQTAAEDMRHAVHEMYDKQGEAVDDTWKTNHLNKALSGLSRDQQGRCMVNFLNSAAFVNSEDFEADPRWAELKNAETFNENDVNDLLAMTNRTIDQGAGFMARQEFLVMERALHKLPYEIIEAQMNSGPKYAEAYAAAMYIDSQTNENSPYKSMTPYQLGALAANSVESSRLLAQYHYGKLRMKDLMHQLKERACMLLLNAAAFALRALVAVPIGRLSLAVMVELGVTNTFLLAVIPIAIATMTFAAFSQEDTIDCITSLWDDIKTFVGSIFSFFKRETPSATVENTEHDNDVSSNSVTETVPVNVCINTI